jgi:hypothetical protein
MTAAVEDLDALEDAPNPEGRGGGAQTPYGLTSLRRTNLPLRGGVEMRLTRAALDPHTGMVVFDAPRHDTPTSAVVEVRLP